jgi:Na+/proline symporter
VLIALTLMFERTRKAGFYASLILMSVFSIYNAAVLLHFFDYVPCSCGGLSKKLSWPQQLIINLFFVAISIAGVWLQGKRSDKDRSSKPVVVTG